MPAAHRLRELVKATLSPRQMHRLRAAQSLLSQAANLPRTFYNRHFHLSQFMAADRVNLHLGCSGTRLDGYINIDLRPTAATDLAFDCTELAPFPDESVDRIFSNAFFEHLYVDARPKLLREASRVLKPTGLLLFTGLPDFLGVAQAYLERRVPGNTGPMFDLREAYRYTHGAPEGTPGWWLAQLHKGLLDRWELGSLLTEAGFGDYCIFSYCYGSEQQRVTIGVVARRDRQESAWTVERIRALDLPEYTRIRWDSVELVANS